MNIQQKVGCVFAVISLLVTTPIWYYLLYSILKLVNAPETMWVLFWIYIPVGFIMSFLQVMVKSIMDGDDE